MGDIAAHQRTVFDMLHEFLDVHRAELASRCRVKERERWSGTLAPPSPVDGIPILITQLIEQLRAPPSPQSEREVASSAAQYGTELELRGYSVEHVVHAYGDLCQAVTELASTLAAPISVDEFRRFNASLDTAIAEAVGEFGRRRALHWETQNDQGLDERLGSFAHELRNLLNTAMLAHTVIKSGRVGIGGATGEILDRSLEGLHVLVESTLSDLRPPTDRMTTRERMPLALLLDEVRLSARLEADARGLTFSSDIAPDVSGTADRQMLASALFNLLQNAFKFTRAGGAVTLSARTLSGHVLIDVADECGGLPPGVTEELFRPFEQRGADRSGVGLGLSISRRGVAAIGGSLTVADRPGIGCVFTIDLPQLHG